VRNSIFLVFVFFALLVSQALAQNLADVSRLDEKLKRQSEQTLPGWTHQRVEPFGQSENVLIEFWSSSNRRVKVSILFHTSVEEAREVLQRHAKYLSNKEDLRDLGDEGYTSSSSDVAFRRRNLTVYVRTMVDVDADADARNLTQTQRDEREKSEKQRLSKEFAQHVAKAIDAP
jgi:hypothetical protein